MASAASLSSTFWDSLYSASKDRLYNFRDYTITSQSLPLSVLYLGGLPSNPFSYPVSFGPTGGLVVCHFAGWDIRDYNGVPTSLGGKTWTLTQGGVVRDLFTDVIDGSLWYYNVNNHYPSEPIYRPLRFIYNPSNGSAGSLSIGYHSYMTAVLWHWEMCPPSTCSLGTAYSTPYFSCDSFYFPGLVAGANYRLYTERLTGNGGTVGVTAWDAAGTLASPSTPILSGTPSIYPSTVVFNTGAATGLVFDLVPTNVNNLDTFRITLTRVLSVPTMGSTTTAYPITSSNTSSGGTISDDGGSPILNKGIAFSTSSSPLWTGTHTDEGSGSGSFASYLGSLLANTTYYYRSYAHNTIGEGYGPEYTFTTSVAIVVPTVSTTTVPSIGTTTATLAGNVTSAGNGTVDSKGSCYSSSTSTPDITSLGVTCGSGTGTFSGSISGLTPGTYYYYRAWAHNEAGYGYGSILNFRATCNPPSLSTGLVSPTGITASGFTAGGNVTSLGGDDGCTAGIVAAVYPTVPTTANFSSSSSVLTGPYSASITGLSPGVLYNYRSYATNSAGTTYGTQGTVTTLASLPTVTTTTATNSYSYYTLGGNVTSDGGATTSSGVYFGTSTSPSSGLTGWSGVGSYSGNTPTLSANTRYYYRAFASNSAGTSYGTELNFVTPDVPTVASTTAATSITQTTASTGGNITSDGGQGLIATGVCYATTQNPTTSNSTVASTNTTGTFTSSLTGLSAGTTYYVRAYASNYFGTTYASQISFTTQSAVTLPTVTTTTASESYSYFNIGGNVTSDGGATTSRGVYYGTSASPTSGVAMGTGTGVFSGTTPTLSASTKYYYRAYAINSAGTTYGTELNLTTSSLPSVASTTAATAITQTTASTGGNVTSNGGSSFTEVGVCYGTSSNPTTGNSRVVAPSTTGAFTSSLSGLTSGTTYYVRAYATNYFGTTYAAQISFTTSAATTAPTGVTTSTASANDYVSGSSGGSISSDGGSAVTHKGVCWNTAGTPTTANSLTDNGTGITTFTSSITGLTYGTTYYVRAYATNGVGTTYGNQVSFATPNAAVPTLTTNAASAITATTATDGGNVTSGNGSAATGRGVCWNTSGTPTIANSKTTDGSGGGTFTSSITGLTAGTTYYVRAWATNAMGTGYGNQISFVATASISVNISATLYNQTATQVTIGWFANLSASSPSTQSLPCNVTNNTGSGTHSATGTMNMGQQSGISIETVTYNRLTTGAYTASCTPSSYPSGYAAGTITGYIIPKQ